MAIICTRPGRGKGAKTHGLRKGWKKNTPGTSDAVAAPNDIPDKVEGAIDETEPMVKFGGLVSDDEDGEVERKAIDSRSGRKSIKVEH